MTPSVQRPQVTSSFEPELVRAAMSAMAEGVVWLDRNGTVVLANDSARSIFGEVIVGRPFHDCIEMFAFETSAGMITLPSGLPLPRAFLRREHVIEEPCRIRGADDRCLDVHATASPLFAADGRFLGASLVLRISRDLSWISNDRAADAQRFRALASATAQLVWTTNTAGVTHADSPSWRAFTGQTWDAYRGEGWLDAVHPDDRDRVRRAWFAAVEARDSYEIEYRTRRYDGVFRWTLARGTPVLDAAGEIIEWVGCNWDIHPIKDAERELERIIEFQQMLLAFVGHDLKSPLSAILIGARLLQADTVSIAVRRIADRIARSALRANDIVQLLHDIAQVKLGGGFPVHREEVDIGESARAIIDEQEVAGSGRTIVLTTTGQTTAFVDRARIGQVLCNLISNALQHGKPDTDVKVWVHGTDRIVEVVVENAADAIPKDRCEHIFDPFKAAACGSRTRHLGLGLYIVKTIVEAHGGTVAMDSPNGRVTMRVRLPRDER